MQFKRIINLRRKNKNITNILLFAVLLVLIIFFIIGWQNKKINELKTNLNIKNSELTSERLKIESISMLKRSTSVYLKDSYMLKLNYEDTEKIPQKMLLALAESKEKYDIKVISFLPIRDYKIIENKEQGNKIIEYDFDLKFAAPYYALVGYNKTLQELPFLVGIKELNIKQNEDKNMIEADMKISAFSFFKEASK